MLVDTKVMQSSPTLSYQTYYLYNIYLYAQGSYNRAEKIKLYGAELRTANSSVKFIPAKKTYLQGTYAAAIILAYGDGRIIRLPETGIIYSMYYEDFD